MNKTNLIIQREYLTRVRKKSFILMTFLGPVLIAGLMSLGIYLGMSDTSVYNVLVVDQTPQIMTDSLSQQRSIFKNRFKETSQMKFQYTTTALSNAEFDSSAYSLMLVIRPGIITFPQAELVFRQLPSVKARSYVQSEIEKVIEVEKLKNNNIDREIYDKIRTPVEIVDRKSTRLNSSHVRIS